MISSKIVGPEIRTDNESCNSKINLSEVYLLANKLKTRHILDLTLPQLSCKLIYICHVEESDVYRNQAILEEQRWKAADLDQDGKLTREEYAAMYYPWEHKHMHDSVAQENLEDMDKDKDGLLSPQEYLGNKHAVFS